ncbi:MAG: MOSC domain-containing protein [Thermoanaerobaculia bacterium]|nr:MOSC domain-containing protein [Thermoanaerobaculia bacterium]
MKLEKIWVKRVRKGPMDGRERARLVPGRGLEGNVEQGGRRQVTILSAERWSEVERELGAPVDPAARRANLLISGLDLERSRDRVLKIGHGRILIHGETRPCRQMNEAHPGLQAALEPAWGGGAYGEVLEGGEIRVGDPVGWETGTTDAPAP